MATNNAAPPLADYEERSLESPTKKGEPLGLTRTASDSQMANSNGEKSHDLTDAEIKKLDRRIDFTLLPWLSFLYLLSFLDRTAIGNARLFGMTPSLALGTGPKYNIAVSVFYFSYAFFEVSGEPMAKRVLSCPTAVLTKNHSPH
jgi:hypothetical protein